MVTGTYQSFVGETFVHSIQDASLAHGWLPATAQSVTALALGFVGWRRVRRWWTRSLPVCASVAFAAVLATYWYMSYEALTDELAPPSLWIWIASLGFAVAVLVLGWKTAGWLRRTASVLAVPMSVLCVALSVNSWLGYV